jgi:hypothetical protein
MLKLTVALYMATECVDGCKNILLDYKLILRTHHSQRLFLFEHTIFILFTLQLIELVVKCWTKPFRWATWMVKRSNNWQNKTNSIKSLSLYFYLSLGPLCALFVYVCV